MPHVLPRTKTIAVALAAAMTLAHAVEAGPPLICHPFQTGPAALLPWSTGSGWNTPDRSYDVQGLTADTLRVLSPDAPVLARMENLRRASIYAARDGQVAAELMSAVLARALGAAADGGRDPLAWFDAGYLIESYRQADMALHRQRGEAASTAAVAAGVSGYRLVVKAIDLSRGNAEMEYAAALMKDGPAAAEHLRRATSAAKAGSLLARNLGR